MTYKMTTTSDFQTKPDFYQSKDDCLKATEDKEQTNPRYKNFTQNIFTAGDEEQFSQYRDATNGYPCIPIIPLDKNIYSSLKFSEWEKYKDVGANAVIDTFRYIFHKFKKGIFVKILENKLRVFLPFSKAHFNNEWGDRIRIDKAKYGSIQDFMRIIAESEGRRFYPRSINENTREWYANNCLVRYENPIKEGESNVGNVKNMLEELCAHRKVPDIEFFINRRDFPIITRNSTEPYNNIWDSVDQSLVSHNYNKYIPILSMSNNERYADVLMPTYEDWARVQSHENKWFPRSCRDYSEVFDIPWEDKYPTAVFRGGTTGCGVTIDTNPRLKAAFLSVTTPPDPDGIAYLDAGITNWNLRPRKIQGQKYLQTIDIDSLPFGLSNNLTPKQQAGYKYILNLDGHVTAFRLSLELNMGSVILWAKSDWKIWYSELLIPYKHYVPVKPDLSDLIDQIKWCRNHDDECKEIVYNARSFFNTFIQKNGILDYMQKILVDIKNEVGVYLYNIQTPLNCMIEYELSNLKNPKNQKYPNTDKKLSNIGTMPLMGRCYGLLQGIEWVIQKILNESRFENFAQEKEQIFQNKLGIIKHFMLAGVSLVVKMSKDRQKIREHIHEAYIGIKSINELTKYIPNFAYVFGMYLSGNTVNVITERIKGETLYEYINGQSFQFQEYLFIIIQLALAIQIAQNITGLIHYDLTPWNIMLQRLKKPISFDYIIDHNNIIRINTTVIPVIIDYGKSHVIYDEEHHGFINMFKVSSFQDMLTLLVTSIDQIINKQRLAPADFSNLFRLANFLSNTGYRQTPFKNAGEIRSFFDKARKYTALIEENKYELENLKPLDLVDYILKMPTGYQFAYEKVNEYRSNMNKGNARQVFEYILSNTVEERLSTYENVFIRLKHCSLPRPKNLFFIYYAVQQLENNLISVRDNMMYFLQRNNIDSAKYEKIFEDTMRFLHKVYMTKIDTVVESDISYEIYGNFEQLTQAPYTEDTFLIPEKILQISQEYFNTQYIDLSEYQDIITMILVYRGKYVLKPKDREYYLDNFSRLLSIDTLTMKNNTANVNTLNTLVKRIYQEDIDHLQVQSPEEGDCSAIKNYLSIYSQLLLPK